MHFLRPRPDTLLSLWSQKSLCIIPSVCWPEKLPIFWFLSLTYHRPCFFFFPRGQLGFASVKEAPQTSHRLLSHPLEINTFVTAEDFIDLRRLSVNIPFLYLWCHPWTQLWAKIWQMGLMRFPVRLIHQDLSLSYTVYFRNMRRKLFMMWSVANDELWWEGGTFGLTAEIRMERICMLDLGPAVGCWIQYFNSGVDGWKLWLTVNVCFLHVKPRRSAL